jgi:uncharacterized membrane protein
MLNGRDVQSRMRLSRLIIKINQSEQRKFAFPVGVISILALIISLHKLFTPYSFWMDELWSVNTSQMNTINMLQQILGDVHPPLYQIVLKLWIVIFGDSETTLRILSWILISTGVAILLKYLLKLDRRLFLIALPLIISNHTVLYYSNESRSYALLFLLSVLALVNLPLSNDEKVSVRLYFTLILLSLSHYFGLLLALVIIIFIIKSDLRKRVVFLIVLLAWPFIHLLFGNINSKVNEGFWIKNSNILESLGKSSNPFFPGNWLLGAFLITLFYIISISFQNKIKRKMDNKSRSLLFMHKTTLLISISLTSIVVVVDIYFPISTDRNFIVLVPYVFVSAGIFILWILQNKPRLKVSIYILIFVYSFLSLFVTYSSIKEKSIPRDDWKAAIKVASTNSNQRQIYYKTYDGIIDYYFEKNAISPNSLIDLTTIQGPIKIPAVLLTGRVSNNTSIYQLINRSDVNVENIYPLDPVKSKDTIGVYLINPK